MLAALMLSQPVAGLASPDKEAKAEHNELKAAYIFNFSKFVDWPVTAFANPAASMIICVLDDKAFGNALEAIIQKAVKRRPFEIVPYDDAAACHILFIGQNNDRTQVIRIFESLKNKSVLTVGDSRDFIRLGGMIRFFSLNNRLSFEINPVAASLAHLEISSKLLNLGKITRYGP